MTYRASHALCQVFCSLFAFAEMIQSMFTGAHIQGCKHTHAHIQKGHRERVFQMSSRTGAFTDQCQCKSWQADQCTDWVEPMVFFPKTSKRGEQHTEVAVFLPLLSLTMHTGVLRWSQLEISTSCSLCSSGEESVLWASRVWLHTLSLLQRDISQAVGWEGGVKLVVCTP